MAGAARASVAAHRGLQRRGRSQRPRGQSSVLGDGGSRSPAMARAMFGPSQPHDAMRALRAVASCADKFVLPPVRSASGPKKPVKSMDIKSRSGRRRSGTSSLLNVAARSQGGRSRAPDGRVLARSAPTPFAATAKRDRPQAAFAVRKNCIFSEAKAKKSSTWSCRLFGGNHLDEPSGPELGEHVVGLILRREAFPCAAI